MINTLYGIANDHRDIARKVITKVAPEPFITIVRNFDDRYLRKNLSIGFTDNHGFPVSVNFPGLYAIYRKVDNKMECLYVGQSGYSIHNRVRRFYQALEGTQRHDESHSGGEKAREAGVKSSDEMYLKYIRSEDIEMIDEEFYRAFGQTQLDEYIAPLLKSRFNTRKAYA